MRIGGNSEPLKIRDAVAPPANQPNGPLPAEGAAAEAVSSGESIAGLESLRRQLHESPEIRKDLVEQVRSRLAELLTRGAAERTADAILEQDGA